MYNKFVADLNVVHKLFGFVTDDSTFCLGDTDCKDGKWLDTPIGAIESIGPAPKLGKPVFTVRFPQQVVKDLKINPIAIVSTSSIAMNY